MYTSTMKLKTNTILIFIIASFLFLSVVIADDEDKEYDIRAEGGWSDLMIDAGYLMGGAGTDLIDMYESNSDATLLDIRFPKKDELWRFDVRKSDTTWFSDLSLYIRRTGSGSGSGSISGGNSYIEILDMDREFFSGNGHLNNIPLQYKLSGVSVQVPPGTYSTTVIFTLVDL